MAPREKDVPYFSVHDFESTKSRIVFVNTGGQKRDKEKFSGEQQAVDNECRVRMHKHACLQRRFPCGIGLGVNVSICSVSCRGKANLPE
jgi:hypothetical protein